MPLPQADRALPLVLAGSARCDGTSLEEGAFEGRRFRAGDRVALYKRAGTFKPAETGLDREVEATAPMAGTALCIALRDFDKKPVLVVVDWDTGDWHYYTREDGWLGETASLGHFISSVHMDHVKVVRD